MNRGHHDIGSGYRISTFPDVAGNCVRLLGSSREARWEGLRVESYRAANLPLTARYSYQTLYVGMVTSGFVHTEYQNLANFHQLDSGPGTVSVIPAGTERRASIQQADSTVAYLSPSPNELYELGAEHIEVVPKPFIHDPKICTLLSLLQMELADAPGSGGLFAETIGLALTAHVFRHYAAIPIKPRNYRGGLSKQSLRQTLDYILSDVGKNFPLSELARNVQLSSYHFCRLFKQSTGLAPHQFVLRERIARAKQLLAENQMPLAEIALRLGFTDQSHFSRTFRKVVGTSPRYFSQHS